MHTVSHRTSEVPAKAHVTQQQVNTGAGYKLPLHYRSYSKLEAKTRTSLVVRLHASNAEGPGSIPSQGTKISVLLTKKEEKKA